MPCSFAAGRGNGRGLLLLVRCRRSSADASGFNRFGLPDADEGAHRRSLMEEAIVGVGEEAPTAAVDAGVTGDGRDGCNQGGSSRRQWCVGDGVTGFDVVVDEDDEGIKIGSSSPCFWVAWICKRTLPEELTAGSHGFRPLVKAMEHHNRCSGGASNSGTPAV
ncbi:hypothetical protein ACLOJK_004310 [Asimina triloba]